MVGIITQVSLEPTSKITKTKGLGGGLVICGDMTLNHGVEAQTGDSPYMLEFGANAMRYDTDDISSKYEILAS